MPAGGGRANIADMTATPLTHSPLFRPARAGAVFLGPGDLYRFLVTGAESGGTYFAMEAYVPPGGGPPPHIHRNEDETFYIVEGEIEFLLGDEIVTGGVGDFVNMPRGVVHRFHNAGTTPARMILTFTPAGIEGFFEETLERALSVDQTPPDNLDEVAARYVAAAPRYGLEFID
jgi:quercetin dioxygenase-like cupin family protein